MNAQEKIEQLTAGKNPELYRKIASSKTADEAYEAAKAAGLTTAKDEAIAVFKKWQKQASELSDSDLTNVAGGGGTVTGIHISNKC